MTEDIGARIKSVRVRYGMTQQQFGDVIGKKRSTVAAYEDEGVLPSFNTLIEISNLFEVSLSYLLGMSEQLKMPQDESEIDEIAEAFGMNSEQINSVREGTESVLVLREVYNKVYGNTGE